MVIDPELREDIQSMIVRDQYRYRPHISYQTLRYYQCEDQKTQGCKGVWKIDLSRNDEVGSLHIKHSIIYEHHTYFKSEGGCVDVALYNDCFNSVTSYISKNRPHFNEDTMFLLNVIKDIFRKTSLTIDRKDLIFQICKNHTVAEKLQQYQHMVDWLIMEA